MGGQSSTLGTLTLMPGLGRHSLPPASHKNAQNAPGSGHVHIGGTGRSSTGALHNVNDPQHAQNLLLAQAAHKLTTTADKTGTPHSPSQQTQNPPNPLSIFANPLREDPKKTQNPDLKGSSEARHRQRCCLPPPRSGLPRQRLPPPRTAHRLHPRSCSSWRCPCS